MDCNEAREFITPYVAGELEDGHAAAVAAHLERCEECHRILTVERLLTSRPRERGKRGSASRATRRIAEALQALAALPDGDEELWSDPETLAEASEEAPIIRIAHGIIGTAIQEGACAFRLEPMPNGINVTYEGGSSGEQQLVIPKYIQGPLIARFKVMAGLDISPVDSSRVGHIPVRVGDRDYSLEVSISPAEFGEEVAVHISNQ